MGEDGRNMSRIKYLDRVVYGCLILVFLALLGMGGLVLFGGGNNPGNAAPGVGNFKAKITDVQPASATSVRTTVLVTNVSSDPARPTCIVNLVTRGGTTVGTFQLVGKSPISPAYPQSLQDAITVTKGSAAAVSASESAVHCV